MQKPNLFIVGAAKSGTTMLYHFLKQHPDVFFSDIKEPAYIALSDEKKFHKNKDSKKWQTAFGTDDEYHSIFSQANNEKVIGEASTCYLYVKGTAEKIKQRYPDAKILIILRNPISRAYSSYQHVVRDGEEKESDFIKALKKEEQYINDDFALRWRFVDGGMYYKQVKEYKDHFDSTNLKVIIFEEFVKNKDKGLTEICDFLAVDSDFKFDTDKIVNVSGVFDNKLIAFIYRTMKNPPLIGRLIYKFNISRKITNEILFRIERAFLTKRKVNEKEKIILKDKFEDDINKLQVLIKKELSIWK